MNNVVWEPVEEDYWGYLNVERMGSVVTVAVEAGLEMDKGYIIAPLPPNVRVCRAVSLPQPDWADVPNSRIRWWAVNPDGRQVWGEGKAACPRGYWRGIDDHGLSFPFYVVAGDKIDLPLGIDWRLTLVERPQKEPAS